MGYSGQLCVIRPCLTSPFIAIRECTAASFGFTFLNEHILRFLNLRYPRDYNTVPRLPFLLLHLIWIFPWSVFLPAVFKPGHFDKSGSRITASLVGVSLDYIPYWHS